MCKYGCSFRLFLLCCSVALTVRGRKGAEMFAQIQDLVKKLEEILENKCNANQSFSSPLE